MQRASWAAPILAVIFVALLASVATNFDFRAFYCAGSIARDGGNPYTVQPLHNCERALANDPFKPYSAVTALPAPLPGYAIALFVPFSYLPFAVAAHLWTLLLCLAGIVAGLCIARVCGVAPGVVFAAMLLSVFIASLGLGETVPLFVAALALTGLFAARQQWSAAGLAAAATLIEPHLGLPVVVALALFVPQTRRVLAVAVAALAAISFATLGPAVNVEYLTRVLPEHALSEIGSDAQLSFSVVAHAFGIAPHLAAALGTLSYIVACAAGVSFARILALQLKSKAFYAFTPAAFAVMGGTFIHVTQMAAALPFALLLWTRAPKYRNAIAVAVAAIAIPWRVIGSPLLMTAAVAVVAYLAWQMSSKRWPAAAAAAGAAVVLLAVLNYAIAAPPMHARASVTYAALLDARYAEASWAAYNDRYLSTGAPERWARRIPTWAALMILAGCTTLVCVRAERRQTAFAPARARHAL